MKQLLVIVFVLIIIIATASCFFIVPPSTVPTAKRSPSPSATVKPSIKPSTVPGTPGLPRPSAGSSGGNQASRAFDFSKEDVTKPLDDALSMIGYPKVASKEEYVNSGTFEGIGPYKCYRYKYADNSYLYINVSPDKGNVLQIELSLDLKKATTDTRGEFSNIYIFLVSFVDYNNDKKVRTDLKTGNFNTAGKSSATGEFGAYWYYNDGAKATIIIRKA